MEGASGNKWRAGDARTGVARVGGELRRLPEAAEGLEGTYGLPGQQELDIEEIMAAWRIVLGRAGRG